jgi:hypothetical protein
MRVKVQMIPLSGREGGWKHSLHISKSDRLGVRHLFKRKTEVNEHKTIETAAAMCFMNTPADLRRPGRGGGTGMSGWRRRAERENWFISLKMEIKNRGKADDVTEVQSSKNAANDEVARAKAWRGREHALLKTARET